MSNNVDTLNLRAIPDSHYAAGMYERYLWLGHCVFNPDDFREDEISIGQDPATADAAVEYMKQAPEKRLIEQLGCVLRAAGIEVNLPRRLTPEQDTLFQNYLVRKISPLGKDYAHLDGNMRIDPDLEYIRSPFEDREMYERTLRYSKSGTITASFLRYATLEKLLPGYPPATSGK